MSDAQLVVYREIKIYMCMNVYRHIYIYLGKQTLNWRRVYFLKRQRLWLQDQTVEKGRNCIFHRHGDASVYTSVSFLSWFTSLTSATAAAAAAAAWR